MAAPRIQSAAEARLLAAMPTGAPARYLAERGLPTRRVEAWKWSDLRAAAEGALGALKVAEPKADTAADAEDSAQRGDVVALLAAAFGRTEHIRVKGGESLVRVDVVSADGFAPRALTAEVEPGGSLTRVVLQHDGAGLALDSAYIRVRSGGVFRQATLSEGAKLARLETDIVIDGEGAAVDIAGLYLAGDGRHADLTSRIAHDAPSCTTRQLVKGAVRSGGRGIFQGKIVVAPGAQKTDARQAHHALLLEEGAEAYAKPELLIHADDVQCAHGNTIGALDENALFYLRARGLNEAEARAMLVEAFLAEAIPDYLDEAMRARMSARISVWLRGTPS